MFCVAAVCYVIVKHAVMYDNSTASAVRRCQASHVDVCEIRPKKHIWQIEERWSEIKKR